MHSEVEKRQSLICVYLLEVANPKCYGDIEFPLHPYVDYGVVIIEMFGPDPIYLMYHLGSKNNNLIMIKTQIKA